MLTGNWENFEELELKLSLPELEALISASRDKENRAQVFAAALKGIDLNESSSQTSRYEEVKQRAEAKLAGLDTQTKILNEIGFGVEGD